MRCRHCAYELNYTFLDLGFAPPSNAYLSKEDLVKTERYFPLVVKICTNCWLAQTEDYASASELFDESYAYFSATSTGWMNHAKLYNEEIVQRLKLDQDSFVVEVASNDGYLLRNFLKMGIPCLGIEPTASTAIVAEELGIPVLREFFGVDVARRLASSNQLADLVIGNNVYAHVPDINDFTLGLKSLLKPNGVITLEFPHLMQLIANTQFDTVYHEHFSYLSLHTVQQIFAKADLRIWDVEQLTTHGGSLRVFGCHSASARESTYEVDRLLKQEIASGLQILETYTDFQSRANKIKDELLFFLLEQKRMGKVVAAYGAAAKGNTLLNYAGVKTDLIAFVCDAASAKQGMFMPGSHIPILAPEYLEELKIDFLLILPWNIAPEVILQNSFLRAKGTKFVTAIPLLEIL
jgi:hypothetical protein